MDCAGRLLRLLVVVSFTALVVHAQVAGTAPPAERGPGVSASAQHERQGSHATESLTSTAQAIQEEKAVREKSDALSTAVLGPRGKPTDPSEITGAVGPSGAPPEQPVDSEGGASAGGPRSPGADLPLGGTREPTVVVNPTNPLNVAYASLFELRVSNDGGATFEPAVPASVPGTHSLCGDPSLAFDSAGRLFWTYLGCQGTPMDIFVARVNPATGAILADYPINVTASATIDLPAQEGFCHDKQWIAADCFPGGEFQDRLYLVWTEFLGINCGGSTRIITSYSTDQGMTWDPVEQLSGAQEGFVWPAHITVAPNADVYAAYHSQPTFVLGQGACRMHPNGVSGKVFVSRSMDGGETWPQKTLAYGPGQADMTFNIQTSAGTIPRATFWTQGSVQPWVLADPTAPGRIYVVAADDPDNNNTAGDAANVYMTISTDSGATWGPKTRIDSGPGTTFQVMPTAAIDKQEGCIVVHYYDNRGGATNAAGNFLLDVYTTISTDGGLTFSLDFPVNDLAFDPDPGAPCRFDCDDRGDCPFVPTTRIGEYNGVALGSDSIAHAVWTGNGAGVHQIIYDNYPCTDPCGDFGCGAGEDTCNCPQDCGPDSCGNGICCGAQGEDCNSCPLDCDPCRSCGDGMVNQPSEDCDPPGSLCANGELCEADCTCPKGECVVFTDEVAFETFNADEGKFLKGVETFQESILPPFAVDSIDDPLCGGIPNLPDRFPFPEGLLELNLCVQSNIDGANAALPNPRGVDGLAVASVGFIGAISDVVLANMLPDGLDLIFSGPPVPPGQENNHTGVGFNPLAFLGGATVHVSVFDKQNNELLRAVSAADAAGSNFWGVWCPDSIGRINIFDPGNGAEGGDDIQMWVAMAEPPNDHCSDRIPIFDGLTNYDTTGATTDGLAHVGLCQFDGQTYHDIWYNYDATCTGVLNVTMCAPGGAFYDTDLVVYDGCFPDIPCPPGDGDILGCNDDDCTAPSGQLFASRLRDSAGDWAMNVVEGNCYKIRVGGWQDGDQGPGTISIECCGPCSTDVDHDGVTGAFDLANTLGCWSGGDPCEPLVGGCICLDTDGDGCIGALDLAVTLGSWGTCCSDGLCVEGETCGDCIPGDSGFPNECTSETWCADGVDNDCDGSIDCADPDCTGDPDCP